MVVGASHLQGILDLPKGRGYQVEEVPLANDKGRPDRASTPAGPRQRFHASSELPPWAGQRAMEDSTPLPATFSPSAYDFSIRRNQIFVSDTLGPLLRGALMPLSYRHKKIESRPSKLPLCILRGWRKTIT
jgi:hypothetical protein